MILKLLLLIGVIAFVYFIFFKKRPQVNKHKTKTQKEKLQGNDMIECPSCGIYFEIDDGVLSSGNYYCSSECVTKAMS